MQADRKEKGDNSLSQKQFCQKYSQKRLYRLCQRWRYYRLQNQRRKEIHQSCWNRHLGNIKKLLHCSTTACGLLSPTWTPGKRVVLQLFPDFEEMDNLRSSAAAGVSKTMLIGELCLASSSLPTPNRRAQLMESVCSNKMKKPWIKFPRKAL